MTTTDILPSHCHARASRLLLEVASIRDEMGRVDESRPDPVFANAQPRDCYLAAIATWRKIDRLAGEVGVRTTRAAPAMPALGEIQPRHVLELIDSVLANVGQIRHRLEIAKTVSEPALDSTRQPRDVLATLIRVNRTASRLLETPFTPSDVHHVVALALAYASRLNTPPKPAAFEAGRKPADCYAQLERCFAAAGMRLEKAGKPAMSMTGALADVQPGDVYDLAYLVLGQVAYLHALAPHAAPVSAIEPGANGYRLPAHVDQSARTLLAALA